MLYVQLKQNPQFDTLNARWNCTVYILSLIRPLCFGMVCQAKDHILIIMFDIDNLFTQFKAQIQKKAKAVNNTLKLECL